MQVRDIRIRTQDVMVHFGPLRSYTWSKYVWEIEWQEKEWSIHSVRTRMIHFEWIKDGTWNLDKSLNSFSKYVPLPGNCVSLWKREKGWPESDCCSEGKEGEWWFLISQRVGIGNTNSSLPGRPDDAHFKSKNHPIIMFDFIYIIFIIHKFSWSKVDICRPDLNIYSQVNLLTV